jgi:hypothetical protein
MTQKPRRRDTTTTDNPTVIQDPDQEPMTPTPTPAPEPLVDRLSVLNDYAGPDGFLHVLVAVAHDAVFVGQHLRVPVTDRVAGLVEIGFLEVELPDLAQR